MRGLKLRSSMFLEGTYLPSKYHSNRAPLSIRYSYPPMPFINGNWLRTHTITSSFQNQNNILTLTRYTLHCFSMEGITSTLKHPVRKNHPTVHVLANLANYMKNLWNNEHRRRSWATTVHSTGQCLTSFYCINLLSASNTQYSQLHHCIMLH